MVRKNLDRIPDHKLRPLEDDLRLHGHMMAADEVSKTRFRRNQMRAASVEHDTIKSNDTKKGDFYEDNNTQDEDLSSPFIDQLEAELRIIRHRANIRENYPEDVYFISTSPFNGEDTTDCPRCSHTWRRKESSWGSEGYSDGREGWETPMVNHYICTNCNLRVIQD